jgi:hypothetical protein
VRGRRGKELESKGKQNEEGSDYPHSDTPVYDRHPINGRASG